MAKRLGIIGSLYAQPLFQQLVQQMAGASPPFELLKDVPTALALKLRQRQLDGAFLSPIDYARDYSDYGIVPAVGVISEGESGAVGLFFNENLRTVKTIATDASSGSEVILAHLILKEKYNIVPQILAVTGSLDVALTNADAVLAIGDAARTMSQMLNKIDLVDEWTDLTGLPYVHGFWVGRDGMLAPFEISLLVESARSGEKNLEAMGPGPDRDYLAHFEYDLGDQAVESLNEFYRLAYYHGILKDIPEVKFFELEKLSPS